MALTLYTYPGNHRAWKALIAAKYNNVNISVQIVSLENGDNKTAEFLKLNPTGKVPVLSTPNGPIFESNAILKYIAGLRPDNQLNGATFHEQALVDQWLDFVTCEVETVRGLWAFPIFGFVQFKPAVYTQAKKDFFRMMDLVDAHLLNNTFLVGNQITSADLALACSLVYPYTNLLDKTVRDKYVNVTRWFLTIMNQPVVKFVVGNITLATEEKLAAGHTEEKQDKKPAQPKQKQPQQQQPKKEQPKKEEPEEEAPKEEKKPNPLDLLPPSNMKLDNVKRGFFIRKPIAEEYFDQFWAEFDAAGYSIWAADYKYPEDFSSAVQADNLISGFFYRCDPVRKYGFGVVNIVGEGKDWTLCGVWIFRGTEFPEVMADVGDSEEYQWTKLDPADPATKAKLHENFAENVVNGKPLYGRSFFK